MTDSNQLRCFFCGSLYPKRELLRGAAGAICRACVEALRELDSGDPATTEREKATDQATRAVSMEELQRAREARDAQEAAAAPAERPSRNAPPSAAPPPPRAGRAPDEPDAAHLSVGDSTSLLDTLEGAEDEQIDLDKAVTRDHSAHDYQSRIDLAAALVEMGRRHAAVRELLSALESTLLCKDYPAALRCAALIRSAVDVPKVRDRICEILARHAPEE